MSRWSQYSPGVVVLLLLIPRLVWADAVSPQVLESLIKGQPDHAADYTLTEPSGKSRVIRYASREGLSFISTLGDNPQDIVRSPDGKAFTIDRKRRVYAEISNPLLLFDPPLQTLDKVVREAGGTVTADDKGSGTFAGHPTETFVIKFDSENLKRQVTVRAARDLRLLLLNLEMRGGYVGGFSITLSNVTLDPPDSLFVIPAGFAKVEESEIAGPTGLPEATKSEYLTTKSSGFNVQLTGPPFTAAAIVHVASAQSLPKGALLQAHFEPPAGDSVVVEATYDGSQEAILLSSPSLPGWRPQRYGVTIYIFADASRAKLLGTHVQQSVMNFDMRGIKTVKEMLEAMTGKAH